MTIQQKVRNIFAEELKTTAENLIDVCDGTAEITTDEAEMSGEMVALMRVFQRIETEVFKK